MVVAMSWVVALRDMDPERAWVGVAERAVDIALRDTVAERDDVTTERDDVLVARLVALRVARFDVVRAVTALGVVSATVRLITFPVRAVTVRSRTFFWAVGTVMARDTPDVFCVSLVSDVVFLRVTDIVVGESWRVVARATSVASSATAA